MERVSKSSFSLYQKKIKLTNMYVNVWRVQILYQLKRVFFHLKKLYLSFFFYLLLYRLSVIMYKKRRKKIIYFSLHPSPFKQFFFIHFLSVLILFFFFSPFYSLNIFSSGKFISKRIYKTGRCIPTKICCSQ